MSEEFGAMERPEPEVTDLSRAFWTGGREGSLLIQRCERCRHHQHPPLAVCRACQGRTLVPVAVSGRGTVWSFTVNRVAWAPGVTPPYVLAQVELDEDATLRLLTGLVDSPPPYVGMPVRVCFDHVGDTWIPLFRFDEEVA